MNVEEIESAIAQLPPSEAARLAEWFAEFHAQVWDKQIDQNAAAGRLDELIEQAEQDFAYGRCEAL